MRHCNPPPLQQNHLAVGSEFFKTLKSKKNIREDLKPKGKNIFFLSLGKKSADSGIYRKEFLSSSFQCLFCLYLSKKVRQLIVEKKYDNRGFAGKFY